MDSELSLHCVGSHLLPPESFRIIIHVVKVILRMPDESGSGSAARAIAYLKLAITHDSLGKLCIQVLLIRHARSKPLLPHHLSQCDLIIVSVIPEEFSCLRITCFKLTTHGVSSLALGGCKNSPSPSCAYYQGLSLHHPSHDQHHTFVL